MSNVVSFDGVDDYVTCGVNVAVFKMGAGSFSICGRIKNLRPPPTGYNRSGVFGVRTGVAISRYALEIDRLTRTIHVGIIDDLGNIVEGDRSFDVNDSRWHHYCVVINRITNVEKIYADARQLGADIGIAAIGGNINPDGLSYVGYGIFGTVLPLDGFTAEIQLYNRAITDNEVYYNYEHPGNPIKRGIVLNLTQESIQGAQWLDLSGNANHGTYVGGALPMRANLITQR